MGNYVVHNDELIHYGVKGMKWGIRKSKNRGFMKTVFRSAKSSLKHPVSSTLAGYRVGREVLKHPISATKFSYTNAKLLRKKYRNRYMKLVNKQMDSLKEDPRKLDISKDFFKKHANDTVEDILKNSNAALIGFELLVSQI